LRPITHDFANGAGPVLLVSLRPNAAGAGVRVEGPYHAFGVQVGAV
jgi:hypothetical protein